MQTESNFIAFFGYNPFIRILDVFIDNIGSDYSKKEIQELAGISKGALFNHWKKLETFGLIEVTRVFGNTKLYTLNKNSQTVKDLMLLEKHLIEATAPKQKSEVKVIA